jgi:hypothetical protein
MKRGEYMHERLKRGVEYEVGRLCLEDTAAWSISHKGLSIRGPVSTVEDIPLQFALDYLITLKAPLSGEGVSSLIDYYQRGIYGGH